jgi:ABC-type cobalt transport system substrate-binding protein
MKPKVFVGSSVEGLGVAEVVAGYLEADFEPRPWNRGLFRPGSYPLEALDDAVRACQFALIVGTADDVLTKRGRTTDAIRDNLVFELGLFLGVLGRRRAILLVPTDAELALPSDLAGLGMATYPGLAEPTKAKASLVILQRAAGQLRDSFHHEWGLMLRASYEQRDRVLRSRRLNAVRTLHKAVTALRDLFIETPSKALNALASIEAFAEVKSQTSARIRKLGDEWQPDAELLGVAYRLDALVAATQAAVEAFPYPALLISTDQAVNAGAAILQQSWKSTKEGAWAAAQAAFNGFSEEMERKIASLGEQYADWWETHTAEMRRLANELHDALTESAVSIGMADAE